MKDDMRKQADRLGVDWDQRMRVFRLADGDGPALTLNALHSYLTALAGDAGRSDRSGLTFRSHWSRRTLRAGWSWRSGHTLRSRGARWPGGTWSSLASSQQKKNAADKERFGNLHGADDPIGPTLERKSCVRRQSRRGNVSAPGLYLN